MPARIPTLNTDNSYLRSEHEAFVGDMRHNAELLNKILNDAEMQWSSGHESVRAWVLDENSVPVAYHAAQGSTPAQRAVTVPATDSSVWVRTQGDTDFLSTYNAAKQ